MCAQRRICILTPGALGSGPRVVKEADALHDAGYDVTVISTRTLAHVDRRDDAVLAGAAWHSVRLDFRTRGPGWRLRRTVQAACAAIFRLTGHGRFADRAISAFGGPLVAAARQVPADLYIAHYPAALPAAALAARRRGVGYAFDAEDYHPGDLPEAPAYEPMRRVVEAVEGRYLPGCAYVTAASPGIADAYAAAYGIARPTVILNVFPRAQAPPRPTARGAADLGPSVYWFSQTIGPGRGLECAVQAIGRAATRPHLYLRGSLSAGFAERLDATAAESGAVERLHILPPEPPSEMPRLAAAYDVGLSGEPGRTANNRMALGNKVFTYLIAGVPAVMSDIAAHRALAAEAGDAVRLYASDDPASLATALDALLGDPVRLAATRTAAYNLGQTRFNWDVEKASLLDRISAATPTCMGAEAVASGACCMKRMLETFRFIRDRVPVVRRTYGVLREPYYRLLEGIFPDGIRAALASGDVVRLHPRFLGIRPEAYEPELTRLMAEHVKPGATVLDAGAHVGLHTLMLSRRAGGSGRVLAVEPSPVTAALLIQHLEWNRCHNVQLIEAAIGDKERYVAFTYRPDPTDAGGFANSLAYDIGGKTTTVRMTTIDRICAGSNPDLIKMDIEGAELLALRGAQETLARAAPLLVVSVHPEAMQALSTTPAELVAFLASFGYEGRHLNGRPAGDLGFGEFIFRKQTALA